jgi:hypothetical protein
MCIGLWNEELHALLCFPFVQECHVDEVGRYKSPLPACLVGKEVLGEGNLAGEKD